MLPNLKGKSPSTWRNIIAMQIDPVCGMQVDEKQSAAQSEYKGQTYHFCSQGCKAKFDQNPQQYVRGAGQTQPGSGTSR